MKALVLTEYNRLDYQDVPEPEIGPEEVLIRVKACGICGSDVHGMDGSTGRRRPPVIMGHEASGIIARVGVPERGTGPICAKHPSGRSGKLDLSPGPAPPWNVGDRVTFDSTIYCGDCPFCRAGQINLCDNRRVLGVSCDEYRRHGAFAEYVAVPQRILYRLPEGLSFERAAVVEPLSVAFHAVHRTRICLDDTALVVGTGMVGLLVVQALRIAGCGRILAVDLDRKRLDLACTLGADEGLQPGQADVPAEVLQRTGGRGADVALEVAGLTPTVQMAIASLRKGGQLTLVGNFSPKIELPLQAVVTRELTLNGSCASKGEYPACLNMLARGAVNVDAITSAAAPLSEGASWFQRLYKGEEGLMKVILRP